MEKYFKDGNLSSKEKSKLIITYDNNLGKTKEIPSTDMRSGKSIHSYIINKLVDMEIL